MNTLCITKLWLKLCMSNDMNRTKALECMMAEKSRDKNELGERVEVFVVDFWDPPTLEAPIFSLDSLLQTRRSKTLKTFFSALVAKNLALSTRYIGLRCIAKFLGPVFQSGG